MAAARPSYLSLADCNCNSLTNDCVRFLTGGSILAWIKGAFLLRFFPVFFTEQTFIQSDLPVDFLSTPLGAALHSTDAMFGRQTGQTIPTTYLTNSATTNYLCLPLTTHLRSRHSATTRLGLQHTLTFKKRLQQQPDHDNDHPPIDQPSIVPQPAGLAPRSRDFTRSRRARRAGWSSPCSRSSRGQRARPGSRFLRLIWLLGWVRWLRARAWSYCDADVWFFLDEKKVCVCGSVLTFLLRSRFAYR